MSQVGSDHDPEHDGTRPLNTLDMVRAQTLVDDVFGWSCPM